jgi:N-acetylglucosamine kinase-like BadF-type ATPase
MNYYLGFDGGGTKTECVVVDEFGRPVGHAAEGPSNPLRVGIDQATLALTNAAVEALAGADPGTRCVRAVCAGLAGAGRVSVVREVTAFLAQSFPTSLVHVTTDLEVALEAAVGSGPGVVLVAGTGSSAYGRNAEGEVARAGGHGPWIGDKGSAFDIGRRALVAVASAQDLGAPPPRLAEMVLVALGNSAWEELVERVAHDPDDVFPQLFPVVVEAAEAGDNISREILSAAVNELADLAAAVIRQLGLRKAEFVLAKSGGVFGCSALLDVPLDDALRQCAPRARISLLRVSPAVGAARLARRLADSRPSGEAHGAEG